MIMITRDRVITSNTSNTRIKSSRNADGDDNDDIIDAEDNDNDGNDKDDVNVDADGGGGGCLAALGTNTYSDTNLSSEENTNYFQSSYKNIYIQNTNTTNQSLF